MPETERKAISENAQEPPPCANISNRENSTSRWDEAISHFQRDLGARDDSGSFDHIEAKVLIDVSGSMQGTKLTAAKLGVCEFVAHLSERDLLSVSCFNHEVNSMVEQAGFHPVGIVRKEIPKWLEDIQANGGTALYDALAQASHEIRQWKQEMSKPGQTVRHVLFSLTDGADNRSSINCKGVVEAMKSIPDWEDSVMNVVMAVDMHEHEISKLAPFISTGNSKLKTVAVRTGRNMLNGIQEVVTERMVRDSVRRREYSPNRSDDNASIEDYDDWASNDSDSSSSPRSRSRSPFCLEASPLYSPSSSFADTQWTSFPVTTSVPDARQVRAPRISLAEPQPYVSGQDKGNQLPSASKDGEEEFVLVNRQGVSEISTDA